MKNRKEKGPLRYLLNIPLQLLIDGAVLALAANLDLSMADPNPEHLGHPFPVFTLIAAFLFGVITVVVVLSSIIKALKAWKRKRENKH